MKTNIKKSINSNVNSLRNKGIIILENIYPKHKTELFKKKLEKVYKLRKKNNGTIGSEKNQVLYNYFHEDKSLLELIYHQKIDKILSKVLDEDYVLQSSNAQNRILKKNKIKKSYEIGARWHTDSRYIGANRLQEGFSYLVIVALDSFTKLNGPTKFLPYSLKKNSKPPRRLSKNLEKKTKEIIMKEGSVCIMDTGTWHKAGKSSLNSRWSIFSIYTGWFVKPYFDYKKMTQKNIKPIYKKLLHFYSTPPVVSNRASNTLKKFKH